MILRGSHEINKPAAAAQQGSSIGGLGRVVGAATAVTLFHLALNYRRRRKWTASGWGERQI